MYVVYVWVVRNAYELIALYEKERIRTFAVGFTLKKMSLFCWFFDFLCGILCSARLDFRKTNDYDVS